MGRLDGRVAIVTGAGRGLGREHALFLAAQGAGVVVNDLGGDVRGGGTDRSAAQQVVDEIAARGGRGVVSGHDVANWEQAGAMIKLAIESFGDLHVLVNNAGIVRDRTLANMGESDWDSVIAVHLKGHAAPSHHAARYWREQAKSGKKIKASVINTSSASGLAGNFGQANYAAAKLGIVALSRVIALELGRYGVRSNAVSPSARTRLSLTTPGADEQLKPPEEQDRLDVFNPANVSPLIGWLAEENCPVTEQIFHVIGNRILVISMPQIVNKLETDGKWTLEALDSQLPSAVIPPASLDGYFEGFL